MSENSEQDANAQVQAVSLVHTRILWAMAGVVLIGTIAGFIFADAAFGIGFLIGGVLAFVNYYWLKSALKNVFENAARPSFLTLNYFMRYAAIGFVLYAIYLTAKVSMIAVLLGAGSFAFAILVEGLIIIFSSFSKREEF